MYPFVLIICLIKLSVTISAVQFNITSKRDAVNHFALSEGNQTVSLQVTGIEDIYKIGNCHGRCIINDKVTINTSFCTVQIGNKTRILNIKLEKLDVIKSHAGAWICMAYLKTHQSPKEDFAVPTFNLTITVDEPSASTDNTLFYVGIGLGVFFIVAVIIGQTVCILHFKSKAKKAEINKNLTPNKTPSHETVADDVRYVKKNGGSGEIRESVIYEALETVRGAPTPPPIATLPETPRPMHMNRSASHNNLTKDPDERFTRTTPRMPKNKHPGKFNTFDKSTSLERIRNRPPLPVPDEIYEDVTVMAPGAIPDSTKSSGWFKNKVQEQSPFLAQNQKKALFGQSAPMDHQTERVQNSPVAGRKPMAAVPPSSNRMLTPGYPLQGQSGPPIGQLQGHSGRPPMGVPGMPGMPLLPSMISAANLKPVKHARPPVAEPSRGPQGGFRPPADNPRMPGNGFKMPQGENPRAPGMKMPQDKPRMPTGGFRMPTGNPETGMRENRMPGFRMPMAQEAFRMPRDEPRMTPAQSFSNLAQNSRMTPAQSFTNLAQKPKAVPPYNKPKPAAPEPGPEYYETGPEAENYYGSSDDEFDRYDVLPDYRIYGNAPPKKFQ